MGLKDILDVTRRITGVAQKGSPLQLAFLMLVIPSLCGLAGFFLHLRHTEFRMNMAVNSAANRIEQISREVMEIRAGQKEMLRTIIDSLQVRDLVVQEPATKKVIVLSEVRPVVGHIAESKSFEKGVYYLDELYRTVHLPDKVAALIKRLQDLYPAGSLDVTVRVEGGADGMSKGSETSRTYGGEYGASVTLDPASVSAAPPTRITFTKGQKLRNSDFALLRAYGLAHVFVEIQKKRAPATRLEAMTYSAIEHDGVGAEFRYSRITVEFRVRDADAILKTDGLV